MTYSVFGDIPGMPDLAHPDAYVVRDGLVFVSDSWRLKLATELVSSVPLGPPIGTATSDVISTALKWSGTQASATAGQKFLTAMKATNRVVLVSTYDVRGTADVPLHMDSISNPDLIARQAAPDDNDPYAILVGNEKLIEQAVAARKRGDAVKPPGKSSSAVAVIGALAAIGLLYFFVRKKG